MKKVFLICFILLVQIYAQQLNSISKEELQEIKNLNLIKKAEIEIVSVVDTGSLFIINATFRDKPQELYLTKDKKVLLSGNILNTHTGETISVPVDTSITIGKEIFTYGNGTDEYILFTDLECPYCQKFITFLPQLEKHAKFRVFFYISDFNELAEEFSIFVLSQPTANDMIKAYFDAQAYSQEYANNNLTQLQRENLKLKIDEQIQLSHALRVVGAPTIFDKNGKKVVWTNILEKYNITLE